MEVGSWKLELEGRVRFRLVTRGGRWTVGLGLCIFVSVHVAVTLCFCVIVSVSVHNSVMSCL